jgi:hypothetical protein
VTEEDVLADFVAARRATAARRAALPGREFALAGAWDGNGTSIADAADEDLLRGFGD